MNTHSNVIAFPDRVDRSDSEMEAAVKKVSKPISLPQWVWDLLEAEAEGNNRRRFEQASVIFIERYTQYRFAEFIDMGPPMPRQEALDLLLYKYWQSRPQTLCTDNVVSFSGGAI